MNKDWFALAVKLRKEDYVEKQLKSKGFRVSCPKFYTRIRHARGIKRVAKNLFPGYVFVELNLSSQNWREVNGLQGAIGLISCGNRPSKLPLDFVDEFLSGVEIDGIIAFQRALKIGDQIRAVGGPFDRRIGEVTEMSDGQRIKVLMDALNRKIEITISKHAVVVAA